jgi:MFS transporter, CP family, cyanate transporter
MSSGPMTAQVSRSRPRTLLLVLAVLATGSNLRASLTSVGPIIDELRAALEVSATFISLLTTIPLVLFGIGAYSFPWLARRVRPDRLATFLLLLIAFGLGVRAVGGFGALVVGTVSAGMGIAVLNVMMPAIIKQEFPARVGLLMGLYIGAMSGTSGIAAWVTVPISQRGPDGWRLGLGIWVIPALLALLLWLILAVLRQRVAPFAVADAQPVDLRRNRIAWAVTAYMGIQGFLYYTLATWFPSVLRAAGIDATQAGIALSILILVGVPVAFVIPSLAARSLSQVPLVATANVLVLLGVVALLFAPAALPLLWAFILGLGLSIGFSLALTFSVLRTRTSHETAKLSSMSQGGGYLFAVLGPSTIGAVFDLTGTWTAPLIVIALFSTTQGIFGLTAGRPGTV